MSNTSTHQSSGNQENTGNVEQLLFRVRKLESQVEVLTELLEVMAPVMAMMVLERSQANLPSAN